MFCSSSQAGRLNIIIMHLPTSIVQLRVEKIYMDKMEKPLGNSPSPGPSAPIITHLPQEPYNFIPGL